MNIMHDTAAPDDEPIVVAGMTDTEWRDLQTARYQGKAIRDMTDEELAAAIAQCKAMELDLPAETPPEPEAEMRPVQKMARVTRQKPGREIETIQRAWLKLVWPVEKVQITLWMDADIVAMFKESGKGYQKRINTVLRAFTDWHRAHPAARAG